MIPLAHCLTRGGNPENDSESENDQKIGLAHFLLKPLFLDGFCSNVNYKCMFVCCSNTFNSEYFNSMNFDTDIVIRMHHHYDIGIAGY